MQAYLKFNRMFTTVWGQGWRQMLREQGGDGDRYCRDGTSMGINTAGMVGDGDKLLSVCSSLILLYTFFIQFTELFTFHFHYINVYCVCKKTIRHPAFRA